MKKEIENQKKIDKLMDDFVLMIERSWTFERMTKTEKLNCRYMLEAHTTKKALKGTYRQRWEILQACYSAFLDGLGYSGANWRETDESAPTF